MRVWFLRALVAVFGIAGVSVMAGETMKLDTVELSIRPLVVGQKAWPPASWRLAGGAALEAGGAGLRLSPAAGGRAEAWSTTPVNGSQLLIVRLRPVSDGGCFQVFLCAPGPGEKGGYEIQLRLDGGGADPNAPSQPANSVALLKHPEGREVDGLPRFDHGQHGQAFELAVLKVGNWVRGFINQVPVLDWRDLGEADADEAPAGGYVGIASSVAVEVARFDAYTVESSRMTEIAALKPLYLETNLGQAAIVTGRSAAHGPAAQRLADAIAGACGREPAIVTDSVALDMLTAGQPLIVLGNLADNSVVRKLYCEWYAFVDRRFPGPGGYLLQTIHNPYGTGANVVLIGASDDAGLERAVTRFAGSIPRSGVIGRLYEVRPSSEFADLAKWDQSQRGERLIIPVGWPLSFALANYATQDDPRLTAIVYLLTGEERRASLYREQMLRWMTKDVRAHWATQGLLYHLYVVGWMELWDLMEEHPVFSNEDRLRITNWLLRQLRSDECIGSLHLQRYAWGMPHQNHGTRPSLGTFFMARYFRRQYGLKECDVYLNRIQRYFDMQADWAKPMCDSSMHQWEATLENKATYALASGHDRFFTSGAARRAAERALVTTNNAGHLPVFGDAGYADGASSLLSKAAFYYGEGRYLWPMTVRENTIRASTDELFRGFVGDTKPVEPTDLIGVTVVPYDRGFWEGRKNVPSQKTFTPANIPIEKAFDKLAMRSGLGREDEFLLLDGMLGASHDYDDANTIHEYSKSGRTYIVTYDGLPNATIAAHNGVNIVKDGLTPDLPACTEMIHAHRLGRWLVSQTRLNEFSDADWTRTVVMLPGAYFVVIDRIAARRPGTFTVTGRWKTLGEPDMRDDTLTIAQRPKGEKPRPETTTYFHLQVPADPTALERLPARYAEAAREYPYAKAEPNVLSCTKTSALTAGRSEFLYVLAQETGRDRLPRNRCSQVAPGVVRVTGDGAAAYVGAPSGAVRVGAVEIDADVFFLDGETLAMAGGRRACLAGATVWESGGGEDGVLSLVDGQVATGAQGRAKVEALGKEGLAALRRQLLSDSHDVKAGRAPAAAAVPTLESVWQFDAKGKVEHLRAFQQNPGADVRLSQRRLLPPELGVLAVPSSAGQVAFLNEDGTVAKRIDVGVKVNDVVVDDVDRDGRAEVLIARDDCRLDCLSAALEPRFSFAPEREDVVNSTLQLGRNQAVYVFVAERTPRGPKTVCVATGDQRLHGLDPTGKRQWLFWSYAGIFGVHGLVDANGDGVREIVGGNPRLSSTDTVYVLDGHDTYANRVSLDGWGATLSAMAIGDINGDGREEIVVGTGRAGLYAIDPASGRVLWSRKLGDDVRGVELLSGKDGLPLIVAGSKSGFVTAFDGAGRLQWAVPLGQPVLFTTVFQAQADIAVAVALQGGRIVALSRDGTVLGAADMGGELSALTAAGAHRDLIAAAGADGRVRAFRLRASREK